MKLKRNALIFGNAVLFTSLACTEQETGGNVESDAAPLRDNGPQTDAHVMTDGAMVQDDAMQTIDTGSMDTDAAAADSAIEQDARTITDGTIPGDATSPADMMSPVNDMAVSADVAVVPDAAPMPDEGAPMPDEGAPVNVCDEFRGARCASPNDGCCDNGQVVLTCVAGVLGAGPDANLCGCANEGVSGRTEVFCAVPGFVGIAQSGRRRTSIRHLRDLILA
jgi:hypothetical protein